MLHLHSILRWAIFALLLTAIIKSIIGLTQKKDFTSGDNKIGLYLMMFAHIQLILGLVLYFTNGWFELPFKDSMKIADQRFWKVEHIFGMIIAITLITIGRIRSKKLSESFSKHKSTVIFYGLSLIVILLTIPWDTERLY